MNEMFLLKLGEIVLSYGDIAEGTETRGHSIDRLAVGGYFLVEVFAAMPYSFPGILTEFELVSSLDDFGYVRNGEMIG